ncbi:MAG TPA: penicillin-binding transpeptidase domain-containing protein [Myxococcales bacterium]|nr:penicillin-binding transpeptidase domain-containing protein [Myxococcales bacterium]
MNQRPHRFRKEPALILAACAAVGLCFAARGQQGQAAVPGPGETPPALDAEPSTPSDIDPLELNALDVARAVDEARGELDGGAPDQPAEIQQVPAAATNAVVQHVDHPQGLDLWRRARISGDGYVAKTAEGKEARLTLEPHLQQSMEKLLRMYKPVGAALVALDPRTGKVLALAEYGEGTATRPLYPAASVFKIITGAALLEKGISPDSETCYHGGVHRLVGKLLEDKPHLDRRCLSLSMALAKSANVVFAKMAAKHLDAEDLRKSAEQFLFNRPIFDQPVEQSKAVIPEDGLDFAKSAAGFGEVKLSPLHAALIAAAVGNGGVAMEPSMLDSVDGKAVDPTGSMRLLNAETAAALRDMMKLTVSQGTATSSFRDRRRNSLGSIEVAGKTGSLSEYGHAFFKDYSWFVGFAPADDPKIAVATVVVNGRKWRVHAPYIAREALKAYLVGGPLGDPPVARVKHWKRRKKRG